MNIRSVRSCAARSSDDHEPIVGRESGCDFPSHSHGPRSGPLTVRGLSRLDGDRAAEAPAVLVANHAGDFGEKRVVFPAADVDAREEFGSALTHEDRPSGNGLAPERLHAEALGVRVASVAGRTLTFFVCHGFAFEP